MTTEEDISRIEDESGLEAEGSESADIEVPFDPSKIDIQVKPISVNSLYSRLENDELDLTPDFQRQANVWDLKRKSRLIESILLRIPLPSFYFSEDEEGVYAVVDGLQRLSTVFHFMDPAEVNRATKSKLSAFKLKDLQYLQELEGCYFKDLDKKFQRRIRELEITANIIRPSTPPAVKFNVFARLNQGGLPVNAQEIRNAIYSGPWRAKLQELATNPKFLDVTEGKIKSQRQQDKELVLRFIALWQLGSSYIRHQNQNLDDFLNEVVDKNLRHWDDKRWLAATKAFERALVAAKSIFGRHVFRKSVGYRDRSPINRGLFESQLVTLSSLSDDEISALIERRNFVVTTMREKLRTSALSNALLYGTGSSDASNIRIRILNEVWEEVLDV
jgi:hypothetical protein